MPLFTLAGVGIAWLLTGGVVVHDSWVLSSASVKNQYKPCILAEVKHNYTSAGIPYLFEYHGDKFPLGVELTYLTFTMAEEPTLVFSAAWVETASGSRIDLMEKLKKPIEPNATEHLPFGAPVNSRCLRHEMTFDDCIPKREPFTFRFKGSLNSRGMPVEPFDVRLEFHPDYETKVFTTWVWFMMSGA